MLMQMNDFLGINHRLQCLVAVEVCIYPMMAPILMVVVLCMT